MVNELILLQWFLWPIIIIRVTIYWHALHAIFTYVQCVLEDNEADAIDANNNSLFDNINRFYVISLQQLNCKNLTV